MYKPYNTRVDIAYLFRATVTLVLTMFCERVDTETYKLSLLTLGGNPVYERTVSIDEILTLAELKYHSTLV